MRAYKFYVLLVVGDVEPEISGPYSTAESRDTTARQLRRKSPDDGIYWMDVDVDGCPTTGAYTGAFFRGEV